MLALIIAWSVTLGVVGGLSAYAVFGGPQVPASESRSADAEPASQTQETQEAAAQAEKAPPEETEEPVFEDEQAAAAAELKKETAVAEARNDQVAAQASGTSNAPQNQVASLGPELAALGDGGIALTESSGPPWQRFARPFDARDPRPQIAVVVTNLGLKDDFTKAAIELLPPEMTLSFSPYALNLEQWIELARSRGHEVMIDLPMEPVTYPDDDPGYLTLLVALPSDKNQARLDTVLRRGDKIVGLAGHKGSRFAASRAQMQPILESLKDKGLLFLDNQPTSKPQAGKLASEVGVPRVINNRLLDSEPASARTIDSRLVETERLAQQKGVAVAMARPYPITIKTLLAWSESLADRDMVLVPVTAVADRQPLR